MKTLITLSGPTASGKTKLGVMLAKQYDGEVVSCDSMQLYRGMAIGTAAPTEEEREGVPHHMIGAADPAEQWSVARFVREADACVQDILARGKRPILVGGTGLYMDALLRGGDFAKGESGGEIRAALTERLEREGIAPLYAELQSVDPDAAARLSPHDHKRILRALEVYRESGGTITAHNEKSGALPPKYAAVRLALAFQDREDMKRLIDERVSRMAEAGLAEEVRALYERGLPPDATCWQAIGYKEFRAVIEGRAAESDALDEIRLRSRQYAKRQLTWLRRTEDLHWILWGNKRDFAWALQKATEIIAAAGLD